MMTLFFYVLFFSTLGIVVYIYLRELQDQDKHITKNKYDAASDDAFRYKRSIAKKQKIRTFVLVTLVISYIISIILSLVFWGMLCSFGLPCDTFRESFTWLVISSSLIVFIYIILFLVFLFLIWLFLSTVFSFLTTSRKL